MTFIVFQGQTKGILHPHLSKTFLLYINLDPVHTIHSIQRQCVDVSFCNECDARNGNTGLRALCGAEFHFGRFLNVASVIHQCIAASTVFLSRGVTQLTPSVNAESVAKLQRSSLALSQQL